MDGSAILIKNNIISSPLEKADIFLDLFGKVSPTNIEPNLFYNSRIIRAISASSSSGLNSPISLAEVRRSLPKPKPKSTSTGSDQIHDTAGEFIRRKL